MNEKKETEERWRHHGSEGLCPYCEHRKVCPLSPMSGKLDPYGVWGGYSVQNCPSRPYVVEFPLGEVHVPGFKPIKE